MVTKLVVTHMETHQNLRPVNHLLGYARIIRVDLKSDIRQTFGELAVVE